VSSRPHQAYMVGSKIQCGAFTAPTITGLCAALISASCDPHRPLEVWRGKELFRRVNSLAEGAGVRIRTPEEMWKR
jgi:hypothetical protein